MKLIKTIVLTLILVISAAGAEDIYPSQMDDNPALERLQEEGKKAYYKSDYQIALEKLQTGLQQAREITFKTA